MLEVVVVLPADPVHPILLMGCGRIVFINFGECTAYHLLPADMVVQPAFVMKSPDIMLIAH